MGVIGYMESSKHKYGIEEAAYFEKITAKISKVNIQSKQQYKCKKCHQPYF